MDIEKIWVERVEYDDLIENKFMLSLLLTAIENCARLSYSGTDVVINDFEEAFQVICPKMYKQIFDKLVEEKAKKEAE